MASFSNALTSALASGLSAGRLKRGRFDEAPPPPPGGFAAAAELHAPLPAPKQHGAGGGGGGGDVRSEQRKASQRLRQQTISAKIDDLR